MYVAVLMKDIYLIILVNPRLSEHLGADHAKSSQAMIQELVERGLDLSEPRPSDRESRQCYSVATAEDGACKSSRRTTAASAVAAATTAAAATAG